MQAISLLTVLAITVGVPALMEPLGASSFLVFAVPARPFAKPRSLIGGHLISSAVGLMMLSVSGPEARTMASPMD